MKFLVSIIIFTGMILWVISIPPKEKKSLLLQEQAFFKDTIEFKTAIQPILIKNCSPCHFPGGKMFEKLPFDKPETVLLLNERLLKRIKDSKENEVIKEFISQAANSKN